VKGHNPFSQPPIPDVDWSDFEDVTPLAERTGIKYRVLLDVRIRSLLERSLDAFEFQRVNGQEPLSIYVLIALRFLLDRFPSMTRFRFSAGPGSELGVEKVPVLATFHHSRERGYFVALSLDLHKVSLNA
jgi:hypothetical protein